MIYRRLLAFFLSFALIFSSTSALATTSVGGWTALDTITAGATNTINAVKGAGSSAVKSAITIAPQAGKVGKVLLRGGFVGALALAVPQLIGDGVDWVLDPANNSVRYTVPAVGGATTNVCNYYHRADTQPSSLIGNYGSPAAACSAYVISAGGINPVFTANNNRCGFTKFGDSGFSAYMYKGCSDVVSPSTPAQDKHIPIDTVAAKVIANAEAGHAPSQEAVKAVALEGFAAGEHDASLDAAAVPDAGVENPTDPADPVDPAKPVDLSPITAAINALKAMLAGILSSITSLADWFKGEPESNKPEDNKIDIPDVPLPEPDTDISFGGSCPSDLGADFNLYGTNFNFVLMPFSKLCPLLSTFVKPTLILLASFMAVAIVGGRKDA